MIRNKNREKLLIRLISLRQEYKKTQCEKLKEKIIVTNNKLKG